MLFVFFLVAVHRSCGFEDPYYVYKLDNAVVLLGSFDSCMSWKVGPATVFHRIVSDFTPVCSSSRIPTGAESD